MEKLLTNNGIQEIEKQLCIKKLTRLLIQKRLYQQELSKVTTKEDETLNEYKQELLEHIEKINTLIYDLILFQS